jgi:Uma2 family endonuclease
MSALEGMMAATWERLCTTPGFSHPGFTCEITPEGKVILSPTFNYHGWYQARLSVLLAQYAPAGQPFVELAVLTEVGLFEIDVAWSRDFKRIRQQKVASPAPEVCMEVESESNTVEEFSRKRAALFAAGCREFWIIRREGDVEFYTTSGQQHESNIIIGFPATISD